MGFKDFINDLRGFPLVESFREYKVSFEVLKKSLRVNGDVVSVRVNDNDKTLNIKVKF